MTLQLTNHISRTTIFAKVFLLLVKGSAQPDEKFRTALQASHLVSGTRLKAGRKLLRGQCAEPILVNLRSVGRIAGEQSLRPVSRSYELIMGLPPLTVLNISKLATAMPSDLR